MSGSITIPGYSDTNRVPGFYFSLDNSKANTASVTRRVLVLGQMISGSAPSGVASLSAGYSDAVAKYGSGSQCADMVKAYRALDTQGEVWVLPLADDNAAQPAVGGFSIGGTATESGTLSLYIGDQLVSVAVTTGDSAAVVAENIIVAIGNTSGLPVSVGGSANINGDPVTFEGSTLTLNGKTVTLSSAEASGSVVTSPEIILTALNKGQAGNDVLLGISLLGTAGGQATPSGVTVTINAFSGGTTNPTDLSTVLSNQGERVYDLIIHPYTDSGSLTALKEWLNDTAGRWSATQQLYGHAVTAYRGTYGQATSFGLTLNDQHATIVPIADSPSSPLIWAAQIAAQAAISMRENPALPVTGVALSVMPPTDVGRYTRDERNSLLYDGLSTFTVDDSGTVVIERLVTTYQTDAAGLPDNSYLDFETMMCAEICLQDMRIYLGSQFNAYILVQDGSKIGAGIKATTAALIGKACASRYRYQCLQLWCQDPDTFSQNLVAQNAGGGVVKLLMPYNFANQLRVIAGNCQFVKS